MTVCPLQIAGLSSFEIIIEFAHRCDGHIAFAFGLCFHGSGPRAGERDKLHIGLLSITRYAVSLEYRPAHRLANWQPSACVSAAADCRLPVDYVAPTTVPANMEELPILWQASGTYSRLSRAVRLVIRDPGRLAQVPLCEVPVDFSSQMVLVAGLGPTTRNDLGLRIQYVWKEHSRIRVLERQIYPGEESATGLCPASPWTVVVVPRVDLSVEGYNCTSSARPHSSRGAGPMTSPPRPRST